MFRKLLVSVSVVVGLQATALAQQSGSPDVLAVARELVQLTAVDAVPQIVGNLIDKSWPSVEAALRQKNPTLDAATVTALRNEFQQLQVNMLQEAMSDAAPIYARYFTVRELRELVTFYKTPTGKKSLVAMPQASLELLGGLAPRLQLLSQTVEQKFGAILQQRGFTP